LLVLIAGRGDARAEDAQGTPTQSHISPSVLVYEENPTTFAVKTISQRQGCGVRGRLVEIELRTKVEEVRVAPPLPVRAQRLVRGLEFGVWSLGFGS